MSRTAPYDGRSRDVLRIFVKESRPGGPWSGKILEIQVDPTTVVWELKQQLFERRDGYAPGNSRLYYLGVPMANCRTLKDYFVADNARMYIIGGVQGCSEAGKSCICNTQLQLVLKKTHKAREERKRVHQKEQRDMLDILVSASSKERTKNHVLQIQTESAILLISSRSMHHTQAAKACLSIIKMMIDAGADAEYVDDQTHESTTSCFCRLVKALWPTGRKIPPMLIELAALLGIDLVSKSIVAVSSEKTPMTTGPPVYR